MKKNIIYLISGLFAGNLFLSCQSETDSPNTLTGELTFVPVVENMVAANTRAVGETFFQTDNRISVTIQTNKTGATPETFEYIYGDDHIFRGEPAFNFTLDDDYITSLVAKWPAEGERSTEIVTDQRELENYRAADWLTGATTSEVMGIVPTGTPVPLVFTRENVLLDFEIVGQNTTGLKIESLLIELETGIGRTPEAFWAYCGNPNGHAELIVEAGSSLLSSDNYLIGRIRVEGQEQDYTIIFPETNVVFESGHRYLITLTPQGYFMDMYVYIASFYQGDGGIGIPFQQPTPDINGNFLIETPEQLITMSYLIRHYDMPSDFNWATRTYVLSAGFTLTQEYADLYIPIPESMFSGSIRNSSNRLITEINYGNDQVLQLFE